MKTGEYLIVYNFQFDIDPQLNSNGWHEIPGISNGSITAIVNKKTKLLKAYDEIVCQRENALLERFGRELPIKGISVVITSIQRID